VEGKVAQLFGMLHPGESSTVTVRAVFVIDPKAKIRAILSEDLNKFGVLISELRGFEAEVGRDSITLGISAEDLVRSKNLSPLKRHNRVADRHARVEETTS
jgi:hypothetical protein